MYNRSKKNKTDQHISRNITDKCSCIDAISNMKICVHKLVLIDRIFDENLYDKYHHLREKAGRSYDTGGYRSNHYIETLVTKDILGDN